jgi:hypothetical protein
MSEHEILQGYWIEHCGDEAASLPWAVIDPEGFLLLAQNGRAWETKEGARRAAHRAINEWPTLCLTKHEAESLARQKQTTKKPLRLRRLLGVDNNGLALGGDLFLWIA